MHFQVRILENCTNNIFSEKQRTKKAAQMFLDVKVVTERQQFYY